MLSESHSSYLFLKAMFDGSVNISMVHDCASVTVCVSNPRTEHMGDRLAKPDGCVHETQAKSPLSCNIR